MRPNYLKMRIHQKRNMKLPGLLLVVCLGSCGTRQPRPENIEICVADPKYGVFRCSNPDGHDRDLLFTDSQGWIAIDPKWAWWFMR